MSSCTAAAVGDAAAGPLPLLAAAAGSPRTCAIRTAGLGGFRRARVSPAPPTNIGGFAVTTGSGLKEVCDGFRARHDDYNAIMAEALADWLAEAFAEYMHELCRRLVGLRPRRGPQQGTSSFAEEYREHPARPPVTPPAPITPRRGTLVAGCSTWGTQRRHHADGVIRDVAGLQRQWPLLRAPRRRASAASTARRGTSSVLEPRSCLAPVISTISVAAGISAAAARSSPIGAERIGGAVREHRRCLDSRQVFGAGLLGLARWVQRVGEQCQRVDPRRAVGDHHRRHPAAIGMTARDDGTRCQRGDQLDRFDDACLISGGGP